MKRVRFEELKIGDTFKIEYGDYGNWVDATLIGIKDIPNYPHIKMIAYEYNGRVFTDRQIITDFVEV